MNTKGGLISFDSFLSISKDQGVSLDFAHRAVNNPDLVEILFVMKANPSISSTPFASINAVSYYQYAEDEILFSMHMVFRIRDINQMDETNRLWQVDLALISDNDQELRALTERIRADSFPNAKGWYRFGLLLLQIGQSETAQQVYEVMLEQTTDDHNKAYIYSLLGWAKQDQGENEKALTFYQKSLEIYQNILPENHLNLAASYNNIDLVYYNMDGYSKTFSSHEKALEIRQKSLPSNQPSLAMSCGHIGWVYYNIGDYSKGLSFCERAVDIGEQSLPENHPHLQ